MNGRSRLHLAYRWAPESFIPHQSAPCVDVFSVGRETQIHQAFHYQSDEQPRGLPETPFHSPDASENSRCPYWGRSLFLVFRSIWQQSFMLPWHQAVSLEEWLGHKNRSNVFVQQSTNDEQRPIHSGRARLRGSLQGPHGGSEKQRACVPGAGQAVRLKESHA